MITILLPAHNEAHALERCVKACIKTVKKLDKKWEVIIAEDGSSDNTYDVAKNLSKKFKRVSVMHSEKRLGRGRALTRAIKKSKGDIIVYMDVDLATSIRYLNDTVGAIRNGYDFATGSRLMVGSKTKRPLKRELASRTYNFLVRLFLGSKLHDHQCGFKAFKKTSLIKILNKTKDEHWFWDTEILVRAQRLGYKIKEIPVVWKHAGRTTVKMRQDVVDMGSKILKLWFELNFRQ